MEKTARRVYNFAIQKWTLIIAPLCFNIKKSDTLDAVICLDGCTVELTTSRNLASSMNAVEVSHPERVLDEETQSHKLCFYFINGKELEEWFWGMKKGAVIAEKVTYLKFERAQ